MIKGKGLRFGLIGLGSMGQNYLRILASLPGVSLMAVSDADPAKAEEVKVRFDLPFYPDYLKLLPLVDIVCLVTPTTTHLKIATDCLNAGKHLIVEKPFTGNSKSAQALTLLAKEKQVHLTIDMVERFNPAFIKLIGLLKSEKVHGVELARFSPFPERISDTDVVFDMMIHDLDLLNRIVPDEIAHIKAAGEKIRTSSLDRVVATITYSNGIIARVLSNRDFVSKTRKITVTTDKYLIEADLLKKLIYIRDFSTPVPTTIPVLPVDQLTEMIKNFVSLIKGKKSHSVKPEEIVNDISLAERILEAC